MNSINFTRISGSYSEKSIIQRSASELLLGLLEIQKSDSILDVGCGTGKITRRLRDLVSGKVVGVDPSPGMIETAKKENGGERIEFFVLNAEKINFHEEFSVIFCNSTMQWFEDFPAAAKNFFNSLKKNGKVGIQAPAKTNYCPNFLAGIEKIMNDTRTKSIFATFVNPWLFFDSEDEYSSILRDAGFSIELCRIEEIKSMHSPMEVYEIFFSGAAAGYLNQKYYSAKFKPDYISDFEQIMKEAFDSQADAENLVKLVFNRIYIKAVKP